MPNSFSSPPTPDDPDTAGLTTPRSKLLFRILVVLGVTAPMALTSACGGNVVVDKPGAPDPSGNGGGGSDGGTNVGGWDDSTTGDGQGGTSVGGGGAGRPMTVEGQFVTSRAVEGSRTYETDPVTPDTSYLTEEERAALAVAWTSEGLFEHASIASFAALSLSLMKAGAPSHLVEGAHRAALDEVRHARASFAVAAAYRGSAIGPSSLPLPASLPLSDDLVEIARIMAKEGCIGETVSAALVAEQLACATDPAIVGVMSPIAEEEAQHAELSWRLLTWAIETGGEPVRRAVEAVFANPMPYMPAPVAEVAASAAVRRHGRLDPASFRHAAERILRDVVLPSARMLLDKTAPPAARAMNHEPAATP